VVGAFALVGFGYWGPKLARNLDEIAGERWRYLVDIAAERRDEARLLHPHVEATGDLEAVLADERLSAILIATPARAQVEIARRALAAGKHVFVEKPLALSVADAVELAETADRAGLTLMVGHTFEFVPAVTRMRELIRAGEAGELLHLHSQRLNGGRIRSDINALWSIGPHDVSIANHLLGSDPEWASARGACYLQEGVEDIVFATFGYPGGVLAHMHVSWLDPVKTRRTTVVGSAAMLVYDDLDPSEPLRIFAGGTDRLAPVPEDAPWQPPRKPPTDLVDVSGAEPLALELQHFVDCAETGARPRTDAWNGVRVVAALEAAEASLRSDGAPVAVEQPAAAAR
jgi:predicted dehydrogenase